jgi:NAD(P)-dependent dehydrogenase (short-subunit alcohol dehydrogenase family)
MTIIGFLSAKWRPPKDPQVSFEGKTIIVIGANVGLGFEAAVNFVAKGASKVILGVRNISKGENAANQIEQRTGRKGVTEVWQVDLGDYGSVKNFAEKVEGLERVDAVVLNAGVYQVAYETSKYGWEQSLQVNTLSTALLALLLLPTLKAQKGKLPAGEKAVLEIVGSSRHVAAPITPEQDASQNLLEAFNKKSDFSGGRQYEVSKLFAHYASKELAKLAGDDVIVVASCPGPCKSNLPRAYMTNPVMIFFLNLLFFLMFRTTADGARTLVSATVQGEKVHGKWWKDDEIQP